MADKLANRNNCLGQVVTIDVIPDDVLLEIFDFYVFKFQDQRLFRVVFDSPEEREQIGSWQSLVQVCRRWRGLVFGSPGRLNLLLHVFLGDLNGKLARNSLDVWPALPLLIYGHLSSTSVDNVVAELKHSDRICQITLRLDATSQFEIEKLWTIMQVPFPELDLLRLKRGAGPCVPVLPVPDSFLGGSAPRLRYLELDSIPFRGIPNLLMSATHLGHLYLHDIPHSGYISPNAVATCLSMLTSLERLRLDFESPQSFPDQENQRLPLPTRSILPALIWLSFKGVSEYLEELVARIDTPRLEQLSVTFFNDIDFDTPELIRFIGRSLMSNAPNEAHLSFDSQSASVKLLPQASYTKYFVVNISCREPVWQLSSLAQICTTSLDLLSTTENLLIYEPVDLELNWKDGIENIEWLDLLLPFTAVKNLYLSKKFAQRITPALQEITEGGETEVLFNLQNLFLERLEPSEPVQGGIKRFISARRLTNHPVTISVWDKGLTWDGSTNVPNSANKVFVGGLPSYLNEEQVIELLKSFGELKAFNLVRDNGIGPSKGFAFFEYVDPGVTDVAITAFSGMALGDRQLVIQRASVGAKAGQPGFPDLPYEQFPETPRPIMPAGDVTEEDARVLLMLNMVTPDDLVDDDEYSEIVDDVRSEVSKYGPVEDVRIPRPTHGRGHHPSDQANGVGRVYVKFVDSAGAVAGMKALAGRWFAGRNINAMLLGETSQTSPPLHVIFASQPDAPPPLPLE